MAVNLFPGITITKKQRSRSYLRVLFGVEDFTPNSVLFFLEHKTLLSDSSLLTPPPRKPERQFTRSLLFILTLEVTGEGLCT